MPYHSGWAEEAQGNRAASGALVIKGTRGEGRRCAENTNNLTLCRNPAVYGGLRGALGRHEEASKIPFLVRFEQRPPG